MERSVPTVAVLCGSNVLTLVGNAIDRSCAAAPNGITAVDSNNSPARRNPALFRVSKAPILPLPLIVRASGWLKRDHNGANLRHWSGM
jgi:hypothetical protein